MNLEPQTKEQWKRINGFDYEVSTLGRIKSLYTKNILNLKVNRQHYPRLYTYVSLSKNGIKYPFIVSRLVYNTFIDATPRIFIEHINGDHFDNRLENLRAVSRSIIQRTKIAKTHAISGERNITIQQRLKTKVFVVSFKSRGDFKYVGTYTTIEEAITARDKALNELATRTTVNS